MALKITKGDTQIKDAVRLSEEQAFQYQIGIVRNWETFSEVFGFRVGPALLSLTAGISAAVLLSHFRRKMKLGVTGLVTSYMPVVCMPSGFAALCHISIVQKDLVLQKYDCPLCLETRAAIIQGFAGFVYPLFIAPMTSLFYATRHFTVRLPYLREQPKEWLRLMIKMLKSPKGKSGYILVGNFIAAVGVTALELKEFDGLQRKFEEIEKQIDSGLVPQ